jgi:hypothetical protein
VDRNHPIKIGLFAFSAGPQDDVPALFDYVRVYGPPQPATPTSPPVAEPTLTATSTASPTTVLSATSAALPTASPTLTPTTVLHEIDGIIDTYSPPDLVPERRTGKILEYYETHAVNLERAVSLVTHALARYPLHPALLLRRGAARALMRSGRTPWPSRKLVSRRNLNGLAP